MTQLEALRRGGNNHFNQGSSGSHENRFTKGMTKEQLKKRVKGKKWPFFFTMHHVSPRDLIDR